MCCWAGIRPAFVGWHPLGLATPGAPDGCRTMKAVLAGGRHVCWPVIAVHHWLNCTSWPTALNCLTRRWPTLQSQTCLCWRLFGGALCVLRLQSCGICFRQSANRRKTASKFCKNPINCGQHESTLQPVLKRLRSLRSGLIRSSAVGSGSQIQEPSYNVLWFAIAATLVSYGASSPARTMASPCLISRF